MSASPPAPMASAAAPARSGALRWFGRFQLLRLLGKSERCMAWRVSDARHAQELVLVLPRVQPADALALEEWQFAVRQANRLNHPQLASAVEVGEHDHWPYVAYDPRDDATLTERATAKGWPGAEAAAMAAQALRGLAFAHEAGVAHLDLQAWQLLVSDSGQVRVMGMAVGGSPSEPASGSNRAAVAAHASDTLTGRRAAAERDVLALGLVLHHMLAGTPALDEPDTGRVIDRMPPLGREIVRLPWSTAHPVPEALRAIVNRATERQERQRYRSARTLLGAVERWLLVEGAGQGGALAVLGDRLHAGGALPSAPGAAARAARLALMDKERTHDLAEVVLEDLALSFEMLRLVNSAQVRGAQLAGSGPVLTVRRAIALLGLDGVRRAALGLREWPGAVGGAAGADALSQLIERCKRAGRAAVALRPAGYDGEVVYLVALLQNLGRLVVQYHFADEAQQIHRLMQPAPAAREGEPDDPGMPEQAAAYAVLGVDIDAIGFAVARQWGLDDSVQSLVRRLSTATPVRNPDGDAEWLRAAASCGNECAEAAMLPPQRQLAALQRVAQRYARVLGIELRDVQAALSARPTERIAQTAPAPLDAMAADKNPSAPGADAQAVAAPGGLRRAAARRAAQAGDRGNR